MRQWFTMAKGDSEEADLVGQRRSAGETSQCAGVHDFVPPAFIIGRPKTEDHGILLMLPFLLNLPEGFAVLLVIYNRESGGLLFGSVAENRLPEFRKRLNHRDPGSRSSRVRGDEHALKRAKPFRSLHTMTPGPSSVREPPVSRCRPEGPRISPEPRAPRPQTAKLRLSRMSPNSPVSTSDRFGQFPSAVGSQSPFFLPLSRRRLNLNTPSLRPRLVPTQVFSHQKQAGGC